MCEEALLQMGRGIQMGTAVVGYRQRLLSPTNTWINLVQFQLISQKDSSQISQ